MAVLGGISVYDFMSVISAFVIYGNSGFTSINGLIVEEFLQDYQAGEAITTWVASLQIALCLISGFLSGALVKLYGNRFVTITGTLMATLGFVLTYFTKHVAILFLTYSVLTGVGFGLQFVPTLIVPQFVFTKRRELALAFILSGSGAFIMVLPIMFNYLREEYGYRGALLLWAGIMLHSVPLGMLMTMHPQLGYTPVPTGTPLKHEEYPMSDDFERRKKCDKSPREKKPQSKNESSKPNIIIKFGNLTDDSECKNGHELNVSENDESSERKSAENCLPEQSRQKDSSRMLGVHSQLSLESGADRTAEQLSLPRTSLLGELRRTITEMKEGVLELSNVSCRVLIAVVFFFGCGYMMPYFFLPAKALKQGLNKAQAAWLVAAIGMSETTWRLIAGVISFTFKDHIVVFYGLSIVLCGGATVGMLLVTSFNGFLVVSIVYGAGLGSYVCVYTLAATAIVGLSKIVRMIGLISLAWGLAYLTSPALGGSAYEATGNVDVPFYMGSSLQLFAAVILFCYRVSPKYKTRPAVLEANVQNDIEDGSSRIPPGDAALASSHHTLVSTPKLGTHLGVIWRGSGSWVGSTHSRIYPDEPTSLNGSTTSL